MHSMDAFSQVLYAICSLVMATVALLSWPPSSVRVSPLPTLTALPPSVKAAGLAGAVNTGGSFTSVMTRLTVCSAPE